MGETTLGPARKRRRTPCRQYDGIIACNLIVLTEKQLTKARALQSLLELQVGANTVEMDRRDGLPAAAAVSG